MNKRDAATRTYLAALSPQERAALKKIPHCCGEIDLLRDQLANLVRRGGSASAGDLSEARWAIEVAKEMHELDEFPAIVALQAVIGRTTKAERVRMGIEDEEN
jgi:hypothetical protein